MPYNPNDLSVLSYANGFTLWHYKTPDDISDLTQDGYFDSAAAMLRVGDFVLLSANTAGPRLRSSIAIVSNNRGGAVNVNLTTAVVAGS